MSLLHKGQLRLLLIFLLFFTLISCENFNFPEFKNNGSPQQKEQNARKLLKKDIIIGNDTSDLGQHYASQHFAPSNIGFAVYDADSKTLLFSHNRNKCFIPASTTKILTVITAFDVLGDDFRFKTTLHIDGTVKDGVLNGDLYLKGSGDPTFNVDDLFQMVCDLKSYGINKVEGSFYFDKSSLASKRVLDTTMDMDEAYNTGISALSVEYNYVNAHWYTPKGSSVPEIVLSPDLPMIDAAPLDKELQDEVNFEHEYIGQVSKWGLSKERDRKGSHRLPIRRTALYTAQLFRRMAHIQGIALPYPKHQITPSKALTIASCSGASISSAASTLMQYSVNLMAELLFLKSASTVHGQKPSYSKCGEVFENYHKSLFTQIDWTGFTIVNGSGLTSRNRISPEQMLAFLIYANGNKFAGKDITYFLQPSGWGWSLKRRFYRPGSAFRMYAKTGTIDYAVALSGILYTHSGKQLLFTFFSDDKHLRYLYEHDPKQRTKETQDKARRWRYAYIGAMDRIISKWIAEL